MMNRRSIVWTAIATCLPLTVATAQEGSPQPAVRVGIVIDGPWSGNDYVRSLFEREIVDLLGREFDVQFPSAKRLVANWTVPSVRAAVEQSLLDPEVDVVLAAGPVSSQIVATRTELPKPSLAAFVLDAELQGLPRRDGGSGVENLSYVSLPLAIRRDLEAFQDVATFSRVAFLANPHFLDAVPALGQRTQQVAATMGIEVTVVPARAPVSTVLDALPANVDAVYLAPLIHLPQREWDQLIAGLNERRLATFSALGISEVERGVLAGLGTPQFFPQIARRVALNLQRILLGESAATLPVAFAAGERLAINLATARAIGTYPSWTVLTEAVLLNEEPDSLARTLSLTSAVREAVAVNLDVAAQDRAVAAGAENVRRARSVLLPQLGLSSTTLIIDEDRAEASLGSQAQRSLTGGATLSQVLFSEPALANVSIQGDVQDARIEERERVQLDVALDAATGFLNVLRAKALERVQRDNLRVTRSNLELARVRRDIGTSGPGEVFRWEAELANRRIDIIEAQATRRLAETALNRVLHRPQAEFFGTVEPTVVPCGAFQCVRAEPEGAPVLLTADERLFRFVDNPLLYQAFQDFWVMEAMANSPELRALDAAIAAQRRLYRSAANAFFSPTVALQSNVSGIFSKGGAGASGFNPMLPPGSPDLSAAFPRANDFNWNIGVQFSLPLFQGGARFATRAQASEDLDRLHVEREAVAERIEQRTRSALHAVGASSPAIALANEAATAAQRNLDLVTDAYARGVISIIDLLDAQNASLAANEVGVNALYAFLADLMELERAVGSFDFFLTPEEREAVFQRLEDYFTNRGLLSPRG